MGDSMSTIINATTTNGVVIQPDNSGSLVLQTNNGTTALTIDTSQRAAFVAGTAALPAITTTGDTNTGMFFPAADTIAFAEGGTEQMRLTDTGLLQFNSGYGSVSTAYGCRAWVNFNGTGTVAIRASGNVTSITDNGAGDYTINFTTALADANYSVVGTCLGGSTSGSNYVIFGGKNANTSNTQTTSAVQITTGFVSSTGGNGGLIDHQAINAAIFR
jgi:hypothetical protein